MTRLVARLVLAMLILPLCGAIFAFFSGVFAQRPAPPSASELLVMWAVIYAFVGVYWIAVWRT